MIDDRHLTRIAELYPVPKYELTPEVLAYHEAGHVIVGRELGSRPYKAAINRKKLNGITRSKGGRKSDNKNYSGELQSLSLEIRRLINTRAAAGFRAGEISERIYTGASVNGVVLTGSTDDIRARVALSAVHLSALSQYPDLLAKKILTDHWKEVEQIASQLLTHGVIYWDRCK